MKTETKKLIAAIVPAVCLAASMTLAGSAGILGTYQVPRDGDDGYGTLLRYQWDLTPESKGAQLFAQGGYLDGFGESNYTAGSGSLGMDVDLEVAPLEFGVLYDIAMTKQGALYVGLGIGYYFIDNSMTIKADPDSVPENADVGASISFADEFGAFALAGWEHDLAGNLSLFAEARYTYLDVDVDERWTIIHPETTSGMSDSKIELRSESDEYDLGGLGATLGLLWRW